MVLIRTMLVSLFLLLGAHPVRAESPLSNNDIQKLVKIGLPDQVVISKIHEATSTDFDTSVEALMLFQEEG